MHRAPVEAAVGDGKVAAADFFQIGQVGFLEIGFLSCVVACRFASDQFLIFASKTAKPKMITAAQS
ncbi:MAG: hypothetical protein WCO86_03205, partial [Planctomycetota bacterium]